jgi:hypothetical protein
MATYITKNGATLEAEQFFLHKPCWGVSKFCSNYMVRSSTGLQNVKNFDYVVKTSDNKFFVVPKDIFESILEKQNG